MSHNSYFTVAEVSSLLKLSVLTVYKYIHEMELEAVEFGGHYRISQEHLTQFIKNHTVTNGGKK